jgi:predicted O-methyltransferase YrrM
MNSSSASPEPRPAAPGDFEDAWSLADGVPGWLKRGQARLLFDEARALPPGSHVLEIGSHQGRSTVVLGRALAGRDARITCIDPFVDGRLFGGASTRTKLERNLAAAGVQELVTLVADYSTRLEPGWADPFDLLYIDGKHDYWTVRSDLRWTRHLPPGGAVLIHDSFSSIGVTLALLAHVLPSRELTYVGRSDSMALFRRSRPTTRDRLRICREVPWWLRNVGIKVLLRLRLRPVARRFGHDSPYDPY